MRALLIQKDTKHYLRYTARQDCLRALLIQKDVKLESPANQLRMCLRALLIQKDVKQIYRKEYARRV